MTALDTGRSITLSQKMIDTFAEVTGDHQWLHVDTDRAARSSFGGTIAHGMLVASLIPTMVGDVVDNDESVQAFERRCAGAVAVINLGFGRLDFASPVRAGTAIGVEVTGIDTQSNADALDARAEFVVWVHSSRSRIAAAGTLRLRYQAES